MKKLVLFLSVLLWWSLQGFSLLAQVNGTASRPVISTAATPVYYYIESASNGTVTAGSGTANYLGNLMYAPSATSGVRIKHNLRASITPLDNALWQLISEGGALKLKNKGTGLYLTGSHTGVTSTTNTYIYSEYGSTTQFVMRTSDQASFTIAWGSNNLDRWGTSLGANSQTAWYFISPSELNSRIAEAVGLFNTTKAGVHPGQYQEASRSTFSTAIQNAVAARDNADAGDDADALSTLTTAITTYQNSQNQLQISSGSNEYWYWIKGTRGSAATALYAEFQSAGTQVLNKDRALTDKQLWKIVANGSGYALQNKASGTYMNTNIANNTLLKTETAPPTAKPVYFNKSTYATDAVDKIQYYLIEDNTTSTGVSFRMHAGGSSHNWGLMNYTGGISDNCSFQFLAYDPDDVLSTAITECESVYTKAVTGTNPGQYTPDNKATFRAAIDAAISVNISSTATSEEKTTAAGTLNQAKSTFTASRNPIKLSTAGDEVWYYIVSAHSGYSSGQVMTNQNNTAGTSILYSAKTQDPNKLWKFTDRGNGKVAIQNRASSLYISANPRNDGTTATAVGFNVVWLSEGAQLLMNADGQSYLHAQQAGTVIVTWGTSDVNSASAWRLEEIPAADENLPVGITSVSVNQGTYTTTGRGNTDHGMAYATLSTSGFAGTAAVTSITIDLTGTSHTAAIERLKLYSTGSSTRLNPATHTLLSVVEGPFTTSDPIVFTLNSPATVAPGTHQFYIAADIAEEAAEGAILDNRILSVAYTDGNSQAQTIAPATTTTPLHSIVFLTRTVVVQPGDYGSVSYRIPALTIAPDGALVALTDKRKYHSGDLPADIDVIAQRSTDGGKTWSAPVTVAQGASSSTGFGDAAIIRSNSGKLHALYVGGQGFFASTAANPIRSYISTSADNGISWSAPRDITSQLYGAGCSDPVRATWLGSFFGSGQALCLRDGRLMAVMAVRVPDAGIKNYAAYSDDDGLTWQVSNKAIDGGDEAKVVELDNGDILMSTRTGGNRLWTKSADRGVNWSPQSSWTEIWGNACDADIVRYTSTTDGYEKSRLLHTLPNASDRRNLTMWMSEDEGTTWPVKKTICPGTSAYSSVTILPDGTIGVYFEEDGSNAYTMTFVNFSLNWLTSGTDSYQNSPAKAYRTKKSGNWSETGNWEVATHTAVWVTPTRQPTHQSPAITVAATHELTIDNAATADVLTVEAGGKLTIAGGKSLIANQLKLKGNTTDGTATLLNQGSFTGTLEVEQALTGKSSAEASDNWWYLSSPVSNATAAVFLTGNNKLGYYNEAAATYPQIVNSTAMLTPGTGYLVQLNTAGSYTFSGTANTGEITIPLSRTGNSNAKRGFNLIGNPYPSYLHWNTVTGFGTESRRTDIRPTIWYRTRTAGGAMVFDTFDGEDGTDNGRQGLVNGFIPPLQAFWVKVNADNSTTNLVLNDHHRTHRTGAGHLLKVKSAGERKVIRLTIGNGINRDVTIISTNPDADSGYDALDSEKMSAGNTAVPEIFTLAGEHELVINKQKELRAGMRFEVGIRPGTAGTFTLSLSEGTVTGELGCELTDHHTGAVTQLEVGDSYTFTSDGSAANDRFTLHLRTPGAITALPRDSITPVNVSTTSEGHLRISGAKAGGQIQVFDIAGRMICSETAGKEEHIISAALGAGMYLVRVGDQLVKINL